MFENYFPLEKISKSLEIALANAGVSSDLIDAVVDSGFYLRDYGDPFSGRRWKSVSDMMYGNKQFSSSFDLQEFIQYINGRFTFPVLPPFVEYEVKAIDEIHEILSEPRRAHYRAEGSFTYRGQPREYQFKRKIPNPVRSRADGSELSVLPGAYRQAGEKYSFAIPPAKQLSFEMLLDELEPNNPDVFLDARHSYDILRVEQHYAKQTTGLDLAFEIDTALFFATHKFERNAEGQAYYRRVNSGEHGGVIYCFRFREPPVKRSQYLIREFDLFKTFPPARILRQDCGLPMMGPEERNIAITDIDCIIRLHPDFRLPVPFNKSPEYMFPSASVDKFYGKLLEIKDRKPGLLDDLVEYEWGRV